MARFINYGGEPVTLHGGSSSLLKIDCDALTPQDCDAIASCMGPQIGPFGSVEHVDSTSHVPRWLAEGFRPYASGHPEDWPLLVDDVLTTGGSMEELRAGRDAHGVVIVSRMMPWPGWVVPFFVLNSFLRV